MGAAGLALAPTAHAAPGAGTLSDPLVVDAFPYVLARSTADAPPSEISSYDCSPGTDESGGEVVFRFELGGTARVTAWLEGDSGGVDVDVHLVTSPEPTAGVAACVARGNVIAEADLDAGVYWVIVDTYAGDGQAGPFVLHLDAIGDEWVERPVSEGVSWRARRFVDLDGPQVVFTLNVDPTAADVAVRAFGATGCQTVGALGAEVGAVAGVNGGYFAGGCAPVSLLKESGNLLGTNSIARGAFGLSADGEPLVALVEAGADWPDALDAHGGGPLLVVDGAVASGAAAWSAEGFSTAGFQGPNPRTFAGVDAAGDIVLASVDGRRANAAGLSLDGLAAFAGDELGLVDAVNLDGGGSTTMWVAGATPNGVLNYPSDATQEDATHPGSRPTSGGLFVFAPPYNHPPRFQTEPVTTTAVGDAYAYDADAIDLDVTDVVSFALDEGPDGMEVDLVTGELTYAPDASAPASVAVVLRAYDDRGASAEQVFTLAVEGGLAAGGAGGGGGDGATGGADASGGAGSSPDDPSDGGCGCRFATASRPPGAVHVGALVALLAFVGRRRRRLPTRPLRAVLGTLLSASAVAGCERSTETVAPDGGVIVAASAEMLSPTVVCKESDECLQHGRCLERDGRCVAASVDDCRASEWCRGVGRCSLSVDECLAVTNADCASARVCRTRGECTAREGRCVVGSTTDCEQSEHCKRFGRCTPRDDTCVITSDQDCQRSDLCTLGGKCRAMEHSPVWECVD